MQKLLDDWIGLHNSTVVFTVVQNEGKGKEAGIQKYFLESYVRTL